MTCNYQIKFHKFTFKCINPKRNHSGRHLIVVKKGRQLAVSEVLTIAAMRKICAKFARTEEKKSVTKFLLSEVFD